MRIISVVLSIVLFLLITLPVYLILWLAYWGNPYKKAVLSQKIIAKAFRVILFFAGTKITVLGKDAIPDNQAVLYVANHRGLADIPVGYITLPVPTGFVAKKEMKRIPIFSWWMKNMKCLFLDRHDVKEGLKAVLEGIDNIKKGHSMFIMPEGTRSQKDELLPFREGSLKMAEKTGCPIIPVAVSNTDAVFEKQQPWVKRAHVIIHYGAPILLREVPPEEKKFLGAYVRKIITGMLIKDKELL